MQDPALGKGGPKVFGEVKGGSPIYAGLWQLIAAMQAAALVSTKWPTGKCTYHKSAKLCVSLLADINRR